jgi:deoxyribodipyrimidine photo-lyase
MIKRMSDLSRTSPENAARGSGPVIVWFRADLRLADNPALQAAAASGQPVLPVFIWAPEEEGEWPPGAASRWWLHHSLRELESDLNTLGAKLVLRQGPSLDELKTICRQTAATSVFFNRRYEPAVQERDTLVHRELTALGLQVRSFNSALLHEPWTIQNKSGKPFQVFTPFWRTCLQLTNPPLPLPKPRQLARPVRWPAAVSLEALDLLPQKDWASGLRAEWRPGEAGAQERLRQFTARPRAQYEAERDCPAREGTSRLSPHLHFGEVGPRQVWHACKAAQPNSEKWQHWQFITELGWREFAHHLLHHFPWTPARSLRPEFSRFPWREDPVHLEAWKHSRTGYPLVDAGMRQLWRTGWMHNRVRMVVASFLVKNLLIPWQAGAKWFWETLVDANLANNTLGWQWSAGCGADAAPYFRIFNPSNQGRKFDPDAAYVKDWVPELKSVPARVIYNNAVDVDGSLHKGGYPEPIVSSFASRALALEAYTKMRAGE